jgi:hypothetical protein
MVPLHKDIPAGGAASRTYPRCASDPIPDLWPKLETALCSATPDASTGCTSRAVLRQGMERIHEDLLRQVGQA